MTGGSEEGPELPEHSERVPVLVGTSIWVVLLVLGVVLRSPLRDHGHGWWVGVAVAGVVQGLFALWFTGRREARRRAREAAPAAD